ncbi:hypothetical protein [uncultured Planktosalinus sp.]|uniref:hypothetical protein n=1 Tax=uncultured Planktosalinus sp. TaxID=1810935 RepID=UPI0030DA7786
MKKQQLIIFFLTLFFLPEINAQCAMCRAVLESDADGSTAEGINNGILYLMAFPYLLVGVIGFLIYKSRQKARKEDNA